MEEVKELLKITIITGIHLTLRDELGKNFNEVNFEVLKKAKDSVVEIIELYEPFMDVLDKHTIGEEALNSYSEIFKDKKINDSDLISSIENFILSLDNEQKKMFFDGILLIALKNDNKISVKEKQLLAYFYKKLTISDKDFSDYVEEFINEHDKLIISEYALDKGKKSTEKEISRSLIIIAGIFFLILIGTIFWYININNTSKRKIPPLPSIVFKKVIFNRYVAAGNFDTTKNKLFGKLVVFYIKGEADIQFDVKDVKLEKKNNKWIALYKNPKLPGALPFIVDVNISQKDYYEVINVQPKEIDEALASKAGRIVGVVTGIGGAYIGGKMGGIIGSKIGKVPIFSGGIGALIGGAVGGAAAGYSGYVFTKKFLTGLRLSPSINQGDKDRILEKAKALIVAELILDENLASEMKNSFENYIKNFYKRFGIEISEVKFE